MDLKTALEFLDLPKDCTIEELEEKYRELTNRRISREEMQRIGEAYHTVYQSLKAQEPELSSWEKVKHFLYHHKVHLIIGGFIGIVTIGLLYSFITGQIERRYEAKNPPHFEMMFFGAYHEAADLEVIEERIRETFPEWERIKVQLTYAPSGLETEYDFAALQKSMALIITEKPDLYVLDQDEFDKFVVQGMFLPLTSLEEKPDTEETWVTFQTEEDDAPQIYGVDISKHPFFDDVELSLDEYILAIRANARNKDRALVFLERMVDTYKP